MAEKRTPLYGDEVKVPDGFGTWVNGICNTVNPSDEEMLIGVPKGGHASGAIAVVANRSAHLTDWCWPDEALPLNEN